MKYYNAIFISDLHLGSPHLQHDKLLSFLKSLEHPSGHGYRMKKLYLVGDIIDITEFNFKHFIKYHRKLIKKFIRIADSGTEVYYIKGNHEAPIWDIFDGSDFNGISLIDHAIHEGLDGTKYLVIHGHQLDGMIAMHPFLYKVGDWLYKLMHIINRLQNIIRRKLGKPEFSFAHWIKGKTKSAVKFIAKFDKLVVEYAKRYNTTSVIYGHIHIPNDSYIDGIRVINTGTFCEICSYVAEDMDGNLEVMRYD